MCWQSNDQNCVSVVLQGIERIPTEFMDLTKEISGKIVESATGFF